MWFPIIKQAKYLKESSVHTYRKIPKFTKAQITELDCY